MAARAAPSSASQPRVDAGARQHAAAAARAADAGDDDDRRRHSRAMPSAAANAAGQARSGGRKPIAASNARRPPADQVIAGIVAARRRSCRRAAPARARHDARAARFPARSGRAARQLLDRAAVEVARRKIHGRESRRRLAATSSTRLIALEQLRPIDVGDQAHAGDDVADRDVGGALALMLLAHHLVGGRALRRQALARATPSAGVTSGSWSRSRWTS